MMPLFLRLAQGAPTEVTQIDWPHAPEAWQVFLIMALVAAFATACYLLEGGEQRKALKVPLALVRATLIVLAVGILFRPLQSKELVEVKHGHVVLAVDTSRSMAFEDREKDDGLRTSISEALGVSPDRLRQLDRLERVKAALRKDGGAFMRRLAERNRVRLYTFDSTRKRLADVDKGATEAQPDARPEEGAPRPRGDTVDGALASLEGVSADGPSTALGDSLQRILTDMRSERVAAVVLLTDGRSNGGSLAPEAVAGRFKRKNVPIFAVGVGDPEPPRDLAVDDFRAPDVSLAGDVLRGSLRVRAQGYDAPRRVVVRVSLGDAKVAEETVEVGGERPEAEVNFSTKVGRPGEYSLEAEVEADPDELTAENNRAARRVRVIDERIRVLYVEGYPRWEYRYLKNALVRDRHMEVQCLLLSADPGFVQESSPGVTPLTQLPSPEELLKYHVIVLGDVDPEAKDRAGRPVFYDGALETIRELVKDRGGGLLMLSGEQSAPRRYAQTPLADVLPVVIDEQAPLRRDYSQAWRPRLTREGRESALLRLEPDEDRNRELWDAKLQDLYWFAQVLRPKPQAHVLAVHPIHRNQHGNLPLFAWHRYGGGTSFWLGIDETWRWRAEVGDKYPYRFYGQIIRFLSLQSFTRSKRFFITTDRTEYDVGDEVRVRAEVRDEAALAAGPQGKQPIQLERPDGGSETLVLSAVEGDPGKFEGTYKPILTGSFRLHVEPGERFGADEVASRVFEVELPRLELQEPRMDQVGLERIAEASGGRFMRLDGLSEIPEGLPELSEPILVGRSETELWDRPWVFMLFFGLILVEWIGRKVARLL